MPPKVVYFKFKPNRLHWLRRLFRWCLNQIRGTSRHINALENQVPNLYWMIQSRQAEVRLDPQGDVAALRFLLQPIQDSNLAFLADLPALKQLQLLHCERITNEVLKHLEMSTELQSVSLDGTQVSGFGLRYLTGHQHLEFLSLEATCLGMATLDDLNTVPQDDPQKADILCSFGLSYLSSFPQLRGLSLGVTRIPDGSLKWVAQVKSLEGLELLGCRRITDEGLKHLYGHPRLKYLSVLGTQVTEKGVAELKSHLLQDCKVS